MLVKRASFPLTCNGLSISQYVSIWTKDYRQLKNDRVQGLGEGSVHQQVAHFSNHILHIRAAFYAGLALLFRRPDRFLSDLQHRLPGAMVYDVFN